MSDYTATYGIAVFICPEINDVQFEPETNSILTILELLDVNYAGSTLLPDNFDLNICCCLQTGPAASTSAWILACVMDQNWHRLRCRRQGAQVCEGASHVIGCILVRARRHLRERIDNDHIEPVRGAY